MRSKSNSEKFMVVLAFMIWWPYAMIKPLRNWIDNQPHPTTRVNTLGIIAVATTVSYTILVLYLLGVLKF